MHLNGKSPMATSLELRPLESDLAERILAEAARRGQDPQVVVHDLLVQGLLVNTTKPGASSKSDLLKLAGTWTEEDAAPFVSVLADQRTIDPELWR